MKTLEPDAPPHRLELIALAGLPRIAPGDDLAAMILAALDRARLSVATGDVIVIAQKIVSKAEGRLVRLDEVEPSPRAVELAASTGKDSRLVELILAESREILRCRPGLIIVEDRRGLVLANAGIVGAAQAAPSPAAIAALDDPALGLIVICPSNPWLSVLPLLETGDFRARRAAARCPVVAVTPVIAGAAVKGPTARLTAQLGLEVSATSVARFYAGLADGFLLDAQYRELAPEIAGLGMAVATAPTLMTDLDSRVALARETLAFGFGLAKL